jgi:hypothetical protein
LFTEILKVQGYNSKGLPIIKLKHQFIKKPKAIIMETNHTSRFLFFIAFILACVFVNAQTGLQKVIVERYYVSNADDAAVSIGTLPVGSVTYRIFADMKQGYKFQTAYGSPAHTLFIKTSTSFFNNEDRGSKSPTYTKTQAKDNSVMIDSWLSAGAGCTGNFGILKSEDNGVSTVVNADNILQNNDPVAGIPLTIQDGLIAGIPGSFIAIGIDNELGVFDDISQSGNSFLTNNGAWSCLSGAVGPDTTNKVLLAQITTDGEMSFELNIQIGTPEGGTEQYVAKNPVGLETQLSSLTFNSSVNTGIEEPIAFAERNKSQVSVFPNPTSGEFSLRLISGEKTLKIKYVIYNLIGKEIARKNIENAESDYTDKVDLSSCPDGVYFIEVTANGTKSVSKILKK